MTLYRAESGNIGFYIQPDMIKAYSDMGYKIYKTVEVEVTQRDLETEIANISKERKAMAEAIMALQKGVINESDK